MTDNNLTFISRYAIHQLEEEKKLSDDGLKKQLDDEIKKIKKMGRKAFPESKRRKNPISIRFTDGELEFLKMIAEENERELAELVHELVIKAAELKFLHKND